MVLVVFLMREEEEESSAMPLAEAEMARARPDILKNEKKIVNFKMLYMFFFYVLGIVLFVAMPLKGQFIIFSQ